MEFERVITLLTTTDAAEVPVLASVKGQPEPRRFLLKATYAEGFVSTLHLQTFPSSLPCPPSPHLTDQERHHFDHPASAPATSPALHEHRRTIRVISGRSGSKYYFCHETRIDPDVRYLLNKRAHPLQMLRDAGVEVFKL